MAIFSKDLMDRVDLKLINRVIWDKLPVVKPKACPRSLEEAFKIGPETASEFIRLKLKIAFYQLDQGEDAYQVILDLQNDLGMADFDPGRDLDGRRTA